MIAKLVAGNRGKSLKIAVVAASAGNHAQGVALAASRLSIGATVVMPQHSSISKQMATRWYGAKVELYGPSLEAALERARELEANGLVFVHPFDDPDVIAGQGTVGLEIVEALEGVDEIWVPVGGAGLAAGVAVAAKALQPRVKIVAVESDSCPAMTAALEQGKPVEVKARETVADGIRVAKVGGIPFRILAPLIDSVQVVEEAAIPEAILTFVENKKIVTEGAGAITLSGLQKIWELDPSRLKGRKIVLVVSGGNVDSPLLGRILEKALVRTRRVCYFTIDLKDAPGALASLFKLIADEEGNVLDVMHGRNAPELPVGKVRVMVKVELRGKAHVERIGERLFAEGFTRRPAISS
jgi:threonine dehydratase